MRLLLLFLFLAYPMLELALLIKVGGLIGIGSLFGIILLTALGGTLTLRHNGFTLLRRMAETMRRGRPPIDSALDGTLVGLAGLLLIAPGLITDALGLILLVPPVRSLLVTWITRHMTVTTYSEPFGRPQPNPQDAEEIESASQPGSQPNPESAPREPRSSRRPRNEPIIIDGEFERLDERTIDPKKSSRD